MLDFDFAKLNDKEFEAFSMDLLAQFLGQPLERSHVGKDRRNHGRYFATAGHGVVVQCKHARQMDVEALIRHLQDQEIAKLKHLRPARYILVTSLSLSHENKSAIKAALAPWVKAQSDILGNEDLNTILGEFPQVEKQHRKLWFSSASNRTHIFNASIKGRSDFKLLGACSFALKYMETRAHGEAVRKLEELGAVIITGEPGIGKSTLAEQIALQYALSGFELCGLAESIDEAGNLWNEEALQLFYFDDFLGRNYLTALTRRQDSQVIAFLKRVAQDKRKRFILTSRTTVLNQGKSFCDLFRSENLGRNEYELRVDDLSLLDKARILYSHLWNSGLSAAYVSELYESTRYLSIAQHPNYNPRLIAFITDAQKLTGIPPAGYWDYISDTLKNPHDVWAHVFDKQLGREARTLVKLTVLNGGEVPEDLLKVAFEHRRGALASAELAEDYQSGLKLAVGSVLNRTLQAEKATITLFNPSLGDFIVNRYRCEPLEIMECLKALRTEASLSNLFALKYNAILQETHFYQIIAGLVGALLDSDDLSFSYRIQLAAHYVATPEQGSLHPHLQPFTVKLIEEERLFFYVAQQARILFYGILEGYIGGDSVQTTQKAFSLLQECSAADDFKAVSELMSFLSAETRLRADPVFIETYVDWWTGNIREWINQEGVLDDFDQPYSQTEEAMEKLRGAVTEEVKKIAIAFPPDRIETILEACDVAAILREKHERDWAPELDPPDVDGDRNAKEIAAVHDLFERT